MCRQIFLCGGLFALILVSSFGTSRAGEYTEYGTPDDAKALLDRAILAVKADKTKAIKSFNSNAPLYRDRDLFVFCFDGDDGVFTAHEALVGQDVRALRDKTGKSYGEEMYRRAKEDQLTEIAYMSPMPGEFFQVAKRAYIARVADQVCGVSFYRFNGPGTPVEYVPVK